MTDLFRHSVGTLGFMRVQSSPALHLKWPERTLSQQIMQIKLKISYLFFFRCSVQHFRILLCMWPLKSINKDGLCCVLSVVSFRQLSAWHEACIFICAHLISTCSVLFFSFYKLQSILCGKWKVHFISRSIWQQQQQSWILFFQTESH